MTKIPVWKCSGCSDIGQPSCFLIRVDEFLPSFCPWSSSCVNWEASEIEKETGE